MNTKSVKDMTDNEIKEETMTYFNQYGKVCSMPSSVILRFNDLRNEYFFRKAHINNDSTLIPLIEPLTENKINIIRRMEFIRNQVIDNGETGSGSQSKTHKMKTLPVNKI